MLIFSVCFLSKLVNLPAFLVSFLLPSWLRKHSGESAIIRKQNYIHEYEFTKSNQRISSMFSFLFCFFLLFFFFNKLRLCPGCGVH